MSKKYLSISKKLISKWRKMLYLDDIWTINLELASEEEMEQILAFVDTSNAEYFVATVAINETLLSLDEEVFIVVLNEVLAHELIHLVMADFLRTSLILAEGKPDFQQELRYKFEQHTTRFQRAFMDLDNKITDLEKVLKQKPEAKIELIKEEVKPPIKTVKPKEKK